MAIQNNQPKPNIPTSVLRLVTSPLSTGATSASEAMKSVYEGISKERTPDAFTSREIAGQLDKTEDLDRLAKENALKTSKALKNGQLFSKAEENKDALIMQLLKEALPEDLQQAIKERTGSKNDPQAVFAKAQSNPVKVAESLKHIIPQQLQEMLKEAQEEGDTEEVARLENVLSNIDSVFDIAEMENMGEAQHMALLTHVAKLADQGTVTPEVAGLIEKTHKSYSALAENEDRLTGVLTKISRDISGNLGLGPRGDKQLRNKTAILIGAMMSDRQANGSIFNFNDDQAFSYAVPFEPSQLNAPGLSDVTVRLLSKHIAPAWNRIYVGHLTPEQPYANIALLDSQDKWIPNDSAV